MDSYVQINLYNSFREWEGRSPYVLKTDTAYYILVNTNFSEGKNKTLNVFFNGYYESYKIEPSESFSKSVKYFRPYFVDVKNQTPSKWGYKAKHFMTAYMAYSMFVPTNPEVYQVDTFGYADIDEFNFAKSHCFDLGFRYKYNVSKKYGIGINFEWGVTKLHAKSYGTWIDIGYGYPVDAEVKYDKYVRHNFNLELYQRFRLASLSIGDVYFDLGGFGGFTLPTKNKMLCEYEDEFGVHQQKEISWSKVMDLNFGLKARLGYSWVALVAQYDFYTIDLVIIDSRALKLGVELSIPY